MKSSKWFLGVLVIVALVVGVFLFSQDKTPSSILKSQVTTQKPYKVGIFEVVRHPVLDGMVQAFETNLTAKLSRPVEFVSMIPDGDASKIEQMAQKFATEGYDLVYVVGTNLALSLAKKTTAIPIVLGAATDPVSAGLIASWEKPGNNITGTSDLSPVVSQLDRLAQILPRASRIGIIYNPSEDNSSIIVKRFTMECAKRGLAPVTATITNPNDIRQTLVALYGKIDALYAPTDATLQSGFSVLIKTATELKIPIFSVDQGTASQGAIFSVGFDYTGLGRVSAQMATDILQGGQSPANMPIRLADEFQLFFNVKQIHMLGLKVPKTWSREGRQVP